MKIAIQPPLESLVRRSAGHLGITLRFYASEHRAAKAALSLGELERYNMLLTSARKQCWLRGRFVLKRLLDDLGLDTDTSRHRLPHRQWSLSHSADLAIAVGSACREHRGTGVDLELDHVPRPEAARLFLDERELAAWRALPAARRASVLRRLWSIKEAAFKATPHNHGTGLQHYRILDIEGRHGAVTLPTNTRVRCRYSCFDIDYGGRRGCVAFAVSY